MYNNDYAGVGQDGNFDGCEAGQFWQMNGSVEYPHQRDDSNGKGGTPTGYWFRTSNADGTPIFTPPSTGTFVTQKGVRNNIYNPGFNNWNLGIFKKFAINERMGFQFRAEAFNAMNHPNWSPVNRNPTNLNTFGRVTGKTDDVRNLQLSLRFYF